jgi:ribosomal protein S18 acetylase RimI-like enzyme
MNGGLLRQEKEEAASTVSIVKLAEEKMIDIRPYELEDEEDVVALWREVFPDAPAHNDPYKDIRYKLQVQPELFFVALDGGWLVGTAMAGFDGHRGWVYYVAVHPDHRRKGIGSALMKRVELALGEMGCPKLNLQIRTANADVQAFYESLGYQVEDRISMGKRLIGNDGQA